MRGLKDPRLQRMMAAAFLLIGVLLCVMFGPVVVTRTLRTGFRIKDFWTEEAPLEAVMGLVIGVGCVAAGWQISRERSRFLAAVRFGFPRGCCEQDNCLT
jgi:hypothetical protein